MVLREKKYRPKTVFFTSSAKNTFFFNCGLSPFNLVFIYVLGRSSLIFSQFRPWHKHNLCEEIIVISNIFSQNLKIQELTDILTLGYREEKGFVKHFLRLECIQDLRLCPKANYLTKDLRSISRNLKLTLSHVEHKAVYSK